MKTEILKWDMFSLVITFFAGSALHFAYQWSGRSPLVGALCPVNESVWEHIKLLYFPWLVLTALGYHIGHPGPNYLWASSVGVIMGMLFMAAGFYTYTGATGRENVWADIALFALSAAVCFGLQYRLTVCFPTPSPKERVLWLGAAALAGLSLIIFTFAPPRLPLFMDSQTGTYGIRQTR